MSSKNQELIFQLRFQEKMLSKEADKEDKNAMKERRIAKQHLAKGERNFAQYHATNSARSSQHSLFLRENAARVSQMIADLKMAEVQAKMAKSLNAACKEMEKSLKNMNLEQIAKISMKYDQLRGKTQEISQILKPEDAVEASGMNLLDELENEIVVEQTAGEIIIPGLDIQEQETTGPDKQAQLM